jgi:hypothetical protein
VRPAANDRENLRFMSHFCPSNYARLCIILFSLTAASSALTGADSNQVIHLEGATVSRLLGPEGRVEAQEEPRIFSVWLSGCQWAVRLYADTNQPGGVTEVTCDATNIYVFVPDTASHGAKGARFSESGCVYPGCVKVFFLRMGPIWWAYCSSCVTGGTNKTILDFMDLLGNGDQSRAKVDLRVGEAEDPDTRVGAAESWIYPTPEADRARVDPSKPLAHLRPLDTVATNGLSVVTRCSVTEYHPQAAAGTGGPEAEPYVEYIISVNSVSFETNLISFIPIIRKPALILDYREPYRGEYIADHWLNGLERKGARRAPLLPTARSSGGLILDRAIILAIILIPIALAGFSRLRRAREKPKQQLNQSKNPNEI